MPGEGGVITTTFDAEGTGAEDLRAKPPWFMRIFHMEPPRALPRFPEPSPAATHVSGVVVDAAIAVHRALGPGLLESVYVACLCEELAARGAQLHREVPVPIVYRSLRIPRGLVVDLMVDDLVIVEVKAVSHVVPLHLFQLRTYLKLSGVEVGLLLNFNVGKMVDGVRRVVCSKPSVPA